MAKLDIPIKDRIAPVDCTVIDPEKKPHHLRFTHFSAFESWYDPKVYKFVAATSTHLRTFIDLEGPAPRKVAPNRPKTVRDKAALASAQARGLARATPPASSIVTVNGETYGSVLKAFEALGLPIPKHQKFRAELKKDGEKTFSHGGKDYKFKTGGK